VVVVVALGVVAVVSVLDGVLLSVLMVGTVVIRVLVPLGIGRTAIFGVGTNGGADGVNITGRKARGDRRGPGG
jgi:hypothetical protein